MICFIEISLLLGNIMEKVDCLGNPLKVGDEVLIRDSTSDTTYRKGIVTAFREDDFDCRAGDIQIEYNDGRLYCNVPHYYFYQKNKEDIKFAPKPRKVWCFKDRIVKYNGE